MENLKVKGEVFINGKSIGSNAVTYLASRLIISMLATGTPIKVSHVFLVKADAANDPYNTAISATEHNSELFEACDLENVIAVGSDASVSGDSASGVSVSFNSTLSTAISVTNTYTYMFLVANGDSKTVLTSGNKYKLRGYEKVVSAIPLINVDKIKSITWKLTLKAS
nr:MAG TPA: hypothetical protein [Bacteriophage sp.]